MLSNILNRISKNKKGISKWLSDEAVYFLDLYFERNYDFDANGEREALEKISINSPKVVFDVGANVGDWSKLASKYFPNASIHAFELSESTRSALKKNLQEENYIVADAALGSKSGQLEYKDYGDLSTVNSIVNTEFHDKNIPFKKRVANILTGDDYMERMGLSHIDFLKIDVEGAELEVLRGFSDAIRQGKIKVIQFEYGYANGDANSLMKDFYAYLTPAGYEIGKIWTAGVRFSPFSYSANNFDSGPNYLAVLGKEKKLIDSLRSPI